MEEFYNLSAINRCDHDTSKTIILGLTTELVNLPINLYKIWSDEINDDAIKKYCKAYNKRVKHKPYFKISFDEFKEKKIEYYIPREYILNPKCGFKIIVKRDRRFMKHNKNSFSVAVIPTLKNNTKLMWHWHRFANEAEYREVPREFYSYMYFIGLSLEETNKITNWLYNALII